MKIGIAPIPTGTSVDIAILAQTVEEIGFESLWVPDQPVLPVDTEVTIPRDWGNIVEPLIALSRASAVTTQLKLGTAIVVVPERSPILLAKEVATLDMYSRGRLVLGVGVGSLKEEAAILGSDFPRRWSQTRESILAMKELWTTEKSEFHGAYYDFPPVYLFPSPSRQPHPPVLLGGNSEKVFSRIVEWGDGWIPIDVSPERIRQGRTEITKLAESKGQDPKSFHISVVGVSPEKEEIDKYEKAGADRVILSLPELNQEDTLSYLQRISKVVLR